MQLTRRNMMVTGAAMGAAGIAGPATVDARGITAGPFEPNWDSLVAGYDAPEWFRDAKLGIWAHWGPQCVPGVGDWYARQMYIQGTPEWEHHCRVYGHPTKTGFMEIIGRWKAERWDPERLVALYRKAGAKYFVALANHHDNFDTYASVHPWNATRVGPKRDLIAGWAKAARVNGLRFGVSNHSSRAWHWFQSAYGYDPEGPMKGRRYDAARLTRADGKGTWWDGLDPQDLYTGRGMTLPDGVGSIAEADIRHQNTDVIWYGKQSRQNAVFALRWAIRCRELIDKYRPDLLYFDDTELPFDQIGLDIAAHFYNSSMGWNDGRVDAVINGKMMPPEWRKGLVEDLERGAKTFIELYPWQTDTCIGNWHYDKRMYDENRYKSARTVIHILADVVSKNGNLLLSIPVRGDGTIDDKEERIVEDLAAWMTRWGGAIHGTRPWRVHGEGPAGPGSAMVNERQDSPYGARDIRYMKKGATLHAIVLGYPDDGIVRLNLLGDGKAVGRGKVERVTLFDDATPLAMTRTPQALEVRVPDAARNPIGFALAIDGTGLTTGTIAG